MSAITPIRINISNTIIKTDRFSFTIPHLINAFGLLCDCHASTNPPPPIIYSGEMVKLVARLVGTQVGFNLETLLELEADSVMTVNDPIKEIAFHVYLPDLVLDGIRRFIQRLGYILIGK